MVFSSGKDEAFIAPGTAGTVLTSNGAGRNASYQAIPFPADKIQIAQVLLSSTDLLALPTAKLIVAAPGSGKMILPVSLALQFKKNMTAYTIANADNAFEAVYHGDTTALLSILATGLVDQAANTVSAKAFSSLAGLAQTKLAAIGIDLILGGTTPGLTLGDGTVEATFAYQLVTLT